MEECNTVSPEGFTMGIAQNLQQGSPWESVKSPAGFTVGRV